MPQIREQIAMVHLPPSKTLKYLFHVRKTNPPQAVRCLRRFFLVFQLLMRRPKAKEFLPLQSTTDL